VYPNANQLAGAPRGLEVTNRMRGERPFVFTNMKKNAGVRRIAQFIVDTGGLPSRYLPEVAQPA